MPRLRTTVLVVLLVASLLPSLRRDLFVGDETKYGNVIHSIEEPGGSMLLLQIGDLPYAHKPPLHFWLIYALRFVFGTDSILPFVLPEMIAYLLLLLLVGRMAAEWFGEPARDWAILIFGTFAMIWGLAQTARMDLEFILFIALAARSILRFLETAAGRHLLLAGVFTGVAILFKGPMAAVIIALTLLFERLRGRGLPRGPYGRAFLIAAAIPLLWVVPAVMRGGTEFAMDLLIRQNVGRAVSSWAHQEPPWFYIQRAPLTFAPWLLVGVIAIHASFRRQLEPASQLRQRYLVSWMLAVLVPFSIISGKLDIYIMPAMPAMALIIGAFLSDRRDDRYERYTVIVNAVATGVFAFVAMVYPLVTRMLHEDKPETQMLRLPVVQSFFWILLAAAVAGLVLILLRGHNQMRRSVIVVAVVTMVPLLMLSTLLLPLLNDFGSSRAIIDELTRRGVGGPDVAMYYVPYMWSRTMPDSLYEVKYFSRENRKQVWPTLPAKVVVVQRKYTFDLQPRLRRDFVKVGEFRARGRQFDVFRAR